ncbi:hypothetical protein, partial [Streptomyces sp. UNOC14_S4]|uniref:hypothetical protein n=1 Tax=Streptomyces sp. UNOC14_S4 TaxID=2872340 RepID=UPI001E416B7A
ATPILIPTLTPKGADSVSEPDAPLLDYALISEPFPLYAATGTDDPATALHLVVSNGGGDTVYCREIVFSLPEGDLAKSLVEADAGDGNAGENWTVARLEAGTQTLLPQGDYAHFVAKPPQDGAPVDVSGITVTLENLKISRHPGTARIEIREVATTDTSTWPDNPRFTTLPITKFPAPKIPVQAICDFRADKLEVEAGGAVRLMWSGPKTLEYTVSYGGQDHKVNDLEWHVDAIDRDTTFQLSYTVGGTTTHYLTTTVTVKNPKLTGLTVDGDVTVTGATGVQGLTVGGDLTANGNVTAVTGDKIFRIRELRGPLGENLNVNSTISVLKDNSVNIAGDTTMNGALTVGGDLTANGNVTAVTGNKIFRIRDLRGPYGENLGVDSTVEVKPGNDITRGGNSVFANGDAVNLRNDATGGNIYTSDATEHYDAYAVYTETGGHRRDKWYLNHG